MDLKNNQEIAKTLIGTLNLMSEYMNEVDVAYTNEHIKICEELLITFLEKISKSQNQEQGMTIVKDTVILLNNLNDSCNHELIETTERENLCKIIIMASELKGFSSDYFDITEEWREW